MCSIADTSARRATVVALAGALSLLQQRSTASAPTYVFNKVDIPTGTNPVAVVMGDFKNGRPVAAVPEIDAKFASVGAGSPSKRLKEAVKHHNSAGQALESSDIDGAVAEYRKALEEDPDEPYWHLGSRDGLRTEG